MKKLIIVSFLWGILSSLMGFNILEDDQLNIKNIAILFVGGLIFSTLCQEKSA